MSINSEYPSSQNLHRHVLPVPDTTSAAREPLHHVSGLFDMLEIAGYMEITLRASFSHQHCSREELQGGAMPICEI